MQFKKKEEEVAVTRLRKCTHPFIIADVTVSGITLNLTFRNNYHPSVINEIILNHPKQLVL